MLVLERHEAALETSLELAGCYVVTTDVLPASMSAQEVHDSYVSLQKVERDFRAMKTGLLEVRPLFVRKQSRTRGHVFCCMLALKLSREMERRLREHFGTTDSNPHAITLHHQVISIADDVTEEMFGGQHRADERKRAEQVRVTQMNGTDRDRRGSCADEEVCSNPAISKRKTLAMAGVVRD